MPFLTSQHSLLFAIVSAILVQFDQVLLGLNGSLEHLLTSPCGERASLEDAALGQLYYGH